MLIWLGLADVYSGNMSELKGANMEEPQQNDQNDGARATIGVRIQTAKRPRGTGSVYKQKNSPNWWIQYYRNGKPYRESANTPDRRKAEKFLLRRQAEVSTGNF